jgi:hypothetical protein
MAKVTRLDSAVRHAARAKSYADIRKPERAAEALSKRLMYRRSDEAATA